MEQLGTLRFTYWQRENNNNEVCVVKMFHFHCVLGFVHTRSLFGEEYCYIMDAKSVGNLGRYLNVSL